MRELRASLVMILAIGLLFGLIYPLVMTGISQLAFPWQANGSLLRQGGRVVGSALVAQRFRGPTYFHPRPSAVGYAANGSGASNLAPTNRLLIAHVRRRAERWQLRLGNKQAVPFGLVTSSASGLDPDISPAAARYQAPMVARSRHLPLHLIDRLIARHIQEPLLGILGRPVVNVLELNLALDRLSAAQKASGG